MSKKAKSYLPQKLRTALEEHRLTLTINQNRDDIVRLCENLLLEGCPGIKNISDDVLIKEIMEETPTD